MITKAYLIEQFGKERYKIWEEQKRTKVPKKGGQASDVKLNKNIMTNLIVHEL